VQDLLGNSSSRATQTTAGATRCWKHQLVVDELTTSREIVDDDSGEVAFLPHLSRPCSAPRIVDRAGRPSTSSSSSSGAAALFNELAARGRHVSLERFADGTGAFELLSRFQSATFPSLSHVDVERDHGDDDDEGRPRTFFHSDAATISDTNDFRMSDDRDVFSVFAPSAECASLPSADVVRWTVANDSVTEQICHNLNDNEDVPEDDDNELFIDDWQNNDDDCASTSTVAYALSNDVEECVSDLIAGRHITSTPMSAISASHRFDLPQRSEMMRQQLSSSSSNNDNDVGKKQLREYSTENVETASSANGDNAEVDENVLDGRAQGQQRRRRVVMYYPPQAFKFYMEQHMENVMKAYEERQRHRAQLEDEMERLQLPDDARTQMRRMLFQKESYHNRLRRTRMDKSAFRPIAVLGRGAFADVLLVRKRDNGALYAMKRLRKSDVLRNRQAAHVKAERDILAEADNEWIVRLFYSFQVSTSYTLLGV